MRPGCEAYRELPSSLSAKNTNLITVTKSIAVDAIKRGLHRDPRLSAYAKRFDEIKVDIKVEPTWYPSAFSTPGKINIDAQYFESSDYLAYYALGNLGVYQGLLPAEQDMARIAAWYQASAARDHACGIPAHFLGPTGYLDDQSKAPFTRRPPPEVRKSISRMTFEFDETFAIFVTLHEFAHQWLGHYSAPRTPRESRERELAADAWATRRLIELRVSPIVLMGMLQAHGLVDKILQAAGYIPDESHPTWNQRLDAIGAVIRDHAATKGELQGYACLRAMIAEQPEKANAAPNDLEVCFPVGASEWSNVGWATWDGSKCEGIVQCVPEGCAFFFRRDDERYQFTFANVDDFDAGFVKGELTAGGDVERPIAQYRAIGGTSFFALWLGKSAERLSPHQRYNAAWSVAGATAAQIGLASSLVGDAEKEREKRLYEFTVKKVGSAEFSNAEAALRRRVDEGLRKIFDEKTYEKFNKAMEDRRAQ